MNNYIKIALRNVTRKPIFSIITFTGFAFSIAASLLIYLWVYSELSYEMFHPDYQRIYRVLTLSKQGDKIEERGCWTDEDFFKVFEGFRFIEGSPASAFEKPDNIVLSEKTAKKIFGNQSAIGKVLISDKYSKEVYIVGGVIRIPEQSHIAFGYMLSEKNNRTSSYSNNWGDNGFVRVYIKLRKDAQIDEQFISAISNHISRYSKITDKLMFQPLADIHLHSDYQNDFYDKNPGSYKYVWIFSGLAFLIVLMASVNFSALSVARASERSVEIGIRKVTGG